MRLRLPTLRKYRSVKDPYYGLPKPFASDLRAFGPVHVCPCGSQVFNAMVAFDDFDLVWYFLDGSCVNCGNLVKLPCPPDRDEAQTFTD
jgi:hypothetical protein